MLRIKQSIIAASIFLTLFTLPVFADTLKKICSSGAVAIPSNSTTGGTSDITVTETGTISNVKLTGINITHGFIGEISAYLTHGTTTVTIGDDPGVVAVTSPQGCKGKNIKNLTISDTGNKSIETDCTMSDPAYDPADTYKPSSPLSGFNSTDVSGTWSLKIVDRYNYDSVAGSLDSWCLEYTRPTNNIISLSPAEGALSMGTATYPTGVTQDIIIQTGSTGDVVEINRVEFLNVSSGAKNDFIGTITKELPTPASALNSDIKSDSPYTTQIKLSPGDKYKFSALCKPTGTGTRTATFQITTNLSAPNDILSFPLSCEGKVGLYSTTVASPVNMGVKALSSTLQSDFTVSNIGTHSLTLNKSFSADSADIDIQSPTFPLTIAAGGTQTITMKCTPSGAGVRTRTLTLSSTDTPNLSSVDYIFECTGDAALAQFKKVSNGDVISSGDSVNIGTVLEGANVTKKLIDVRNDNGTGSNAPLTLSNPTLTNNGSHTAFSFTKLPSSVSANTTDPDGIEIKCDAAGLTGAPITGTVYTATLKFDTNDTTKSTVSFGLSCTVKAPEPSASFSPTTSLNFNTVGSGGGQLTINVGNASSATKSLTVTPVGFTADPGSSAAAFELQDANGTAIGANISVAIGSNESIRVKCKGDAAGSYSAVLKLTTDDPAKPTITYPVSCTVTANNNYPLYSSTPASGNTIAVGSAQIGDWSSAQTILQVSEIGNAALKVALASLSNHDNFEIDSPALPFTIADGGNPVDIKVKCKPTVAGDGNTATLTLKATDISDNAVGNVPAPTYTLSCKGLVPAYDSPTTTPGSTINVGSVAVNSSVTTTLKIKNVGDSDTNLTVSAATIDGTHPNDFFMTTTLSISVAKGASAKSLTIKCSTTAVGTRTAALHLTTNDPNKSTVTYPLTCTGLAAIGTIYSSDPAVIKNPSTNKWSGTIDFGDVLVNTTAAKTLTISESGSTILNVGEPANAADFLTGETATFNVVNRATLFTTNGSNAINPGFYIQNGAANQVINLTCQPTTTGAHTAILTLLNDDNDTSKQTVTYTLKCNGIKAGYSSTPAPSSTLNCGGTSSLIGTQLIETIKVEELGTVDLKLSSPSLSGAHASDFSIISPTFPVTLANGTTTATTQDIKVKFTPSAAGTRVAKLTFSTNDPDQLTVSYDFSCQAVAPPSPIVTHTLKVAVNPSQAAVVQDNLGQIHCGKDATTCSGTFDLNTAITLTTTAAMGYQFKNWTGDCATGRVILNGDKTCVANFDAIPTPPPTVPSTEPTQPTEPSQPVDPKPTTPTEPVKPTEPTSPPIPEQPTPETPTTGTDYNISVTTTGKGTGKVTSAEMNCQNQQCNQTVAANTLVTLVAQPVAGSTFLGWSGSCSGKTAIITVNITEHKQCIARFEPLATQPEIEDDGLGNYCTGVGYTNIRCNARGAVIADNNGKIEIDTDGYLSNGIVTKPLTNKGWVANLTIEDTGSLEGGIVTGSIVNHGEMSNFEFRGDLLSGGKLSGVIKNNAPNVCFSDGIIHGVIKNVELAANTRVLNGRLSGKIIGDAQQPARLSHVILSGTTVLQNVILEESVIIEQDVNLETTQLVQVKLAPNVKISGGKIIGELHGDATAPAQLDNVLLSAHSTLENVIFGEKVEIADEKTCRSQLLAETEVQNSSETVAAILLTSDGKQQNSATTFTPQLTTAQARRENHSLLSQSEAATLDLSIQVTLQSEHLGKAADILVVAQYQLADKTEYYMKTAQGWKIWKGQLSDLQPLQSYEKLPPLFDISVFNGDLSQTEGELNIYTGYRLQSGDIVFNGLNPLHFAISSPTKSCSLTCGCQ